MKHNLEHILKNGGIAVLPTDTLYGIVGSAVSKKAVQKIYKVRKRTPSKPCIILISSITDLKKFGIKNIPLKELREVWPGKVSVILPCPYKKFEYLHRGTNKLAFRLPDSVWLCTLLKKTGPLVAPSANIEGQTPAYTIEEAENYFGGKVEIFMSTKVVSSPSHQHL